MKVLFRTHNNIQIGELEFIDGLPHLVWQRDPLVTTRLEPKHLQTDPAHVPAGLDAAYGQEVADPRTAH